MDELNGNLHVYRLKSWQRRLYLLLALFLGGFGTVMAYYLTTASNTIRVDIAALLMLLLMVGVGIFVATFAVRSRIVIDGSHIAVRGTFRERSVDLSEIEGFRTIYDRNGNFRRLSLKGGGRGISILRMLDHDEVRAWCDQLTDLDEQDRKAVLEEISEQQELGATPAERLDALKQAKRWNIRLSSIAVVAAAPFFFVDASILVAPARLVLAVILALTPAAVLYLLRREPLLYGLFTGRGDPRANLSIAFIAAGAGLLKWGMSFNFLLFKPLWVVIVTVAVVFTILYWTFGGKNLRNLLNAGLVVMCASIYASGLAMVGDTLADKARPVRYEVSVFNTHQSMSRSTTYYYVDVGPWGPFAGNVDLSVTKSEYGYAAAGHIVCVDLHPGFLQAPWYELTSCNSESVAGPPR